MPIYSKQIGKVFFGNDYAASGVIVLPDSVENYRMIRLNQSTASIAMTLPALIDTSIAYALDIVNIGIADITVEGFTIKAGVGIRIGWESTQWVLISNTAGGVNVTTGPVVPVSGMVEGDVHCFTSSPAGQEYLIGTSRVYDGAVWQDQSNMNDWQIASYISSTTTVTQTKSVRYVVVPTSPIVISVSAGVYSGQTIWFIRGGDWDTNPVNFNFPVGVNSYTVPGAVLSGNEIASVSMSWVPATSSWFITYHSAGQTAIATDLFQVGTLALRPAAPTDATIYYVTGDPTPAENDRWYVYDVTTTAWYEIGNLIEVYSNTTSATPVYPTFISSNTSPLSNVIVSESKISFIPSKGRLTTEQVDADLYLTTALVQTNYAANGLVGTSPTTVDLYSMINIPQTTAGITLTLPTPTVAAENRTVTINNSGTAEFTMHGYTVSAGKSATFVWNGTAWSPTSLPTAAIPVLSNNTSTSEIYPTFVTANNSPLSNVVVSETQITFKPSTGRLSTNQVYANTFVTESYLGSDMPTGGAIGTAATTVDLYTMFNVSQSTAAQTLSLPTPTVNSENKFVIVTNTGTASFLMHGTTIEVGKSAYFAWNGASWSPMTSTSSSTAMDVYDLTTAADFYPTFLASNTSPTANLNITSTRLKFRPSTGKLSTSAVNANVYTTTALVEVNYPGGGFISAGAPWSVDVNSMINIPQTTAGQTLSLPSPSVVTEHRVITINNTGTASFTMHGATIAPTKSMTFAWNGTVWSPISISASATAAGSTSEVQFNTAGAFNANSTFTYDVGTQKLSVANIVSSGTIFANTISANGTVGTAGQVLTSDGSKAYWSSAVSPELFGFGLAVNRPVAPADGFIYYTEGEANPANDGYVFIYDSTTTSWRQLKTLPGGGNYQVQFNNSTVFDGSSAFTFNPTTSLVTANNLTVTRTLTANVISANGTTGTAGQVLKSDGTKTYWGADSAAAAGSTTEVQFNTSGSLAANMDFTYAVANSTLSTRNFISSGTTSLNALSANGSIGTSGQILTTDGTKTYWASPATMSVNVNATYAWTNTHSFSNTVTLGAVSANGTIGLSGQFLASDGSKTYWAVPADIATNVHSSYAWSNTHTFSNTVTLNAISANGSLGTAGQVLTSDGTDTYWSSPAVLSVNTAAQYTWTNTHTFSNTIAVNTISANGTIGTAGQVLTSDGVDTYWSTITTGGGGFAIGTIAARPASANDGFMWYVQGDTEANNGKLLAYDTTTLGWYQVNNKAAGSNTYLQFNNGGYLDGQANLTYNWSNSTLSTVNAIFSGTTSVVSLNANGSIGTSGQVLTSDGTKAYWAAAAASAGGFSSGVGVGPRPVAPSDGFVYLDTSTNTYFIYDSGTATWSSWSGPSGSTSQIQFNSGGQFSASGNLVFTTANSTLGATSAVINNLSVPYQLTANVISANGSIGTSGQVLTSDGTKAYWSTISSGAGGFSSGIGIGPRPVAPADGYIYLDTSAAQYYIYDSGTAVWNAWSSGGGAMTPAGVNKNFQFNNGGVLAGTTNVNYEQTNNTLTFVNAISSGTTTLNALNANGSIGTAGQVLTSDGTKTYWSTVTSGSSTGGFIVAASTASRPATANDGVIFLDTSTGTYSIYDTATPGWFGWTQSGGGGATPGGSNTNIQYNNSGTLAGATSTSWYNANSTLAFANGISNSAFSVNALYANGSIGTSGQVLTTDGTKAYWSSASGGGIPIAQLVNTTRTITYSSNNIYVVNGSGITITLNNGTSAGQQLYFYRGSDWTVGGGVMFTGTITYPSFSSGTNEVAGLVYTWNGAQWIGTIIGQPATGGGSSGGISVGLLSSRPASGADGQLYFVAGDPTPGNNGQLWAYDTATSTWYLVSQTSSSSTGFRTISFIPSTTTALNAGTWTTVYSSSGWNFTNGLISAEVLLEINNSTAGGEILGRFQLNGTTLGQEVHLWKLPNASMAGGVNWLNATMTTIGGVSTGQTLTFQLLNNGGTNNASFLSIAGRESKIIVHGQS